MVTKIRSKVAALLRAVADKVDPDGAAVDALRQWFAQVARVASESEPKTATGDALDRIAEDYGIERRAVLGPNRARMETDDELRARLYEAIASNRRAA